jgi:hypothetical protein
MKTFRILTGAVTVLTLTTSLAVSNPAAAGDRLSPGAAAALGVVGGLAIGGAIAASQRPVYAAPAPVYTAPPPEPVYVEQRPEPVYVAPRRVVVEEEEHCWVERSREWVPGWGWQSQRHRVCR